MSIPNSFLQPPTSKLLLREEGDKISILLQTLMLGRFWLNAAEPDLG